MPIDETIAGNGVSATGNSAGTISDVIISGGSGNVFLEVQSPGNDEWITVTENKRGSFSALTPDITLNYRFRTTNETENVSVYLGP